MDQRPIGIFDSGVGGLTVAREVMNKLPHEKIIYFGDTARVPYGSKTKQTVTKFSKQIIRFLLTKNVKAIIIACNTASSNSLLDVQKEFDIPIIGVVKPGVTMAVRTTINKKIGIIGTEATIKSKAYNRMINENDNQIKVFGKACPLFVPLVEEGWIDDEVTYKVVERYLFPMKEEGVDTIVLGCTHYPLLSETIKKVTGENIKLVNPAEESAKILEKLLEQEQLKCSTKIAEHEFYVSDRAEKFEKLAKLILKRPMMPVQQINIEEY